MRIENSIDAIISDKQREIFYEIQHRAGHFFAVSKRILEDPEYQFETLQYEARIPRDKLNAALVTLCNTQKAILEVRTTITKNELAGFSPGPNKTSEYLGKVTLHMKRKDNRYHLKIDFEKD